MSGLHSKAFLLYYPSIVYKLLSDPPKFLAVNIFIGKYARYTGAENKHLGHIV